MSNLSIFGSVAGCLPPLAPFINWAQQSTTTAKPSVIGKQTTTLVHRRYALLASPETEESKHAALRNDMLTGFIQAKYPGTETQYTPRDVIATSTSVVSAGSDTTSLALSAFFYYILQTPRVYMRLQEEVDQAFDEGMLQYPVTYEQGARLEYLQACLKETLRVHPPISMDMPRLVPEGGLLVANKFFLPPGTTVGANAFVFHRTAGAFGDDAGVFRPERWLEVSGAERSTLERNFLSVSFNLQVV